MRLDPALVNLWLRAIFAGAGFDDVGQAVPVAGGGGVLSVVDLAEHGVIGFADGLGVRRPRPLVADGALVGSVTGCSAF
jgi:hypothetical protein